MLVNCRTMERERKARKSVEEMIARWLEVAARVTEHHLMPRTGEERPEFATHQSRT